jgi:hypothetical protein
MPEAPAEVTEVEQYLIKQAYRLNLVLLGQLIVEAPYFILMLYPSFLIGLCRLQVLIDLHPLWLEGFEFDLIVNHH